MVYDNFAGTLRLFRKYIYQFSILYSAYIILGSLYRFFPSNIALFLPI